MAVPKRGMSNEDDAPKSNTEKTPDAIIGDPNVKDRLSFVERDGETETGTDGEPEAKPSATEPPFETIGLAKKDSEAALIADHTTLVKQLGKAGEAIELAEGTFKAKAKANLDTLTRQKDRFPRGQGSHKHLVVGKVDYGTWATYCLKTFHRTADYVNKVINELNGHVTVTRGGGGRGDSKKGVSSADAEKIRAERDEKWLNDLKLVGETITAATDEDIEEVLKDVPPKVVPIFRQMKNKMFANLMKEKAGLTDADMGDSDLFARFAEHIGNPNAMATALQSTMQRVVRHFQMDNQIKVSVEVMSKKERKEVKA